MEFEIRLFYNNEKTQIISLLEQVFGQWPHFDIVLGQEKHFDWKFIDTASESGLVSVAVTENKIVGISSNVFQRIKIGEKFFLRAKGQMLQYTQTIEEWGL